MLRPAIETIYNEEQITDLMHQAISTAKQALEFDEVPIGAIVVDELTKEIVGVGYNHRELDQQATSHAEILAIEQACQQAKSWRLEHHSLFVTLEPCAMCAGAIINSRINNVVFGASDPKAGSVGSLVNLFELPYNSKPNYMNGVLEAECAALLTNFFRNIRQQKKSS